MSISMAIMERTRVIPAVATNAMITSRHQKWKQEKETHPKACNIWVCLKQVARPMLIVNVAAKGGALGTLRGAIPTHLQSQGDVFQGVKDVKRNRRKVSGQSAPDGRIDWLRPTTANLTSSDQSSALRIFPIMTSHGRLKSDSNLKLSCICCIYCISTTCVRSRAAQTDMSPWVFQVPNPTNLKDCSHVYLLLSPSLVLRW